MLHCFAFSVLYFFRESDSVAFLGGVNFVECFFAVVTMDRTGWELQKALGSDFSNVDLVSMDLDVARDVAMMHFIKTFI